MNEHYPFRPIPLPSNYASYAPCLNPKLVYVHHQKVYTEDIRLLNSLLTPYPQFYDYNLNQLMCSRLQIPIGLRNNIQHYAGSAYNHELYFSMLTHQKSQPTGKLKKALIDTYGSIQKFKELFMDASVSILGSGWVWLIADIRPGGVHMKITNNHEAPCYSEIKPIFVCDVWEHAYFPQYYNQRSRYVENWFSVLNWEMAEEKFQRVMDQNGKR